MSLKSASILFIASALALSVGCDDSKDDTGADGADGGAVGDDGGEEPTEDDCEDGVDNDGDGDVDCDDDDCEDEDVCNMVANDYTGYDGWESFDYNNGDYGAGEFNCQIVWRLSGDPINPMFCTDCEFMFDVAYTQDDEFTSDDGTCDYYGLLGDKFGAYGYADDLDGYGNSWVFGYYGYYYWWGTGYFSGSAGTSSEFQYVYGYKDYAYNGSYYSYYQYGLIDVE